eukprot:ctg_766.g154
MVLSPTSAWSCDSAYATAGSLSRRLGHRQAVIEPEAALVHSAAERRHAGHVLGDGGHHAGISRVQPVVGQHQVHARVHVHLHAEVFGVIATESGADAMMRVQHGGHTVEAEAVKVVLVDPPAQVGEQETQHLPAAVIEAARIPQAMMSALARVKVLVVAAVEMVDAVHNIRRGVRVHHIHQHVDAQSVRRVDERLEVLRCATARAAGEKVGHVVPERGVVRVLHNGHDLDGSVAEAFDTRQHLVAKLGIRADARLIRGHTHVALVDAQRLGARHVLRMLPPVRPLGRRVPKQRVVDERVRVLHQERAPRRIAQQVHPARRHDHHLEFGVVRYGARAVLAIGQEDAPPAETLIGQGVAAPIPPVKVARQVHLFGGWRPLAVPDAVIRQHQAEQPVAAGERVQAALALLDGRFAVGVLLVAVPQVALERLQPRVVRDDRTAVGAGRPVLAARLATRHGERGRGGEVLHAANVYPKRQRPDRARSPTEDGVGVARTGNTEAHLRGQQRFTDPIGPVRDAAVPGFPRSVYLARDSPCPPPLSASSIPCARCSATFTPVPSVRSTPSANATRIRPSMRPAPAAVLCGRARARRTAEREVLGRWWGTISDTRGTGEIRQTVA